MKFILSESQFEKKIMDFILSLPEFQDLEEFDCSDMDWGYGWVEEICFMKTDSDDPTISYYPYPTSENRHWKNNPEFKEELKYLPSLKLNDKTSSTLSSFFGDRWKKPFQKWFESKFGYKVKTLID